METKQRYFLSKTIIKKKQTKTWNQRTKENKEK